MDNVRIVKEVTDAFLKNRNDQATLDRYFAPDFVHWTNGEKSDLKAYAQHLAGYGAAYSGLTIPAWDELFEAGDRVVAAYTLEATETGGGTKAIPVIAIWRLRDGKIVSLREVDAA